MCWQEDPWSSHWCWQCWNRKRCQKVRTGVSADVWPSSPQHHAVPGCVFPPQLPTPSAADGETGWEFRWTTRDSPQRPSSIEEIHSGECIQGSPISAQAHSSNHPQGPDGKKCAADTLFCGQNHGFWKLTYREPTARPASKDALSNTRHTGLHASWSTFNVISLRPQPWYLLVWSPYSLYTFTGTYI